MCNMIASTVDSNETPEGRWRNCYMHCLQTWDDFWSCQCNDECPVCYRNLARIALASDR